MVGESMRQERKVVTALFADLVGSTALTETLDPEDAMEVVGAAIGEIVLVIESLGGTVKDLAGDGVLALFGAPVAHEDDAERAIHAGLRIVETVAARRATAGSAPEREVDVRVGIDTGLVVLGPVGAGSRVEYGATGDTVNIAARLQSAADPGTVLVGPSTHRLTQRRFVWGEQRDLVLKGKSEPVPAWCVVAPLVNRSPIRHHRFPLVGRERELGVLSEAMEAAFERRPSLLVMLGEGGVGKSRLVDEARARADERLDYFNWVALRCTSYEQTVPFGPLRRLLEIWLGVERDTPREVVAERARAEFSAIFGREDADLTMAVELVLGLPASHPLPRSPESGGGMAPFRVAEAVDGILTSMAARAPVVIVVEDLQWADHAFLELLDHTVARVDELPGLLVLLGRPVEGHALLRWAELAGSGFHDPSWAMTLHPLASSASEAQLASRIGSGTLPIDLERTILGTAEGNPYFLEELIHALIDSGAVVLEEHGWEYDPRVSFTVPPTLERVVLARLDRLSDASRDLTAAAAVIGRSFDAGLLGDVAGHDEADVTVMLKDLARLNLVEQMGGEWRFTHPVVQDAAYNALLRRKRRDLHRRVAEALARRSPGALAVLARHWWEAGETALVADLAQRAAVEACGRQAFEEAADQYALAVEAGSAGAGPPPLLLSLADARRRAGMLVPALEAYELAHLAAASAGDTAVLADAALGYEDSLFATRRRRSPDDPTVPMLQAAVAALGDERSARRVRTTGALGRALSYGGRSKEGSLVAAQAVELARRVGDPGAAAYALLAWRTDQFGPERLRARISMAEEAVAAAEGADDSELWVEAARALFVDLLMAARRQDADALLGRLVQRIQAERQPFHLWYLGMWAGQQALLDGDIDRADEAIDTFRREGRRLRCTDVDQVYAVQRLLVMRERGRPDEASPAIERMAALDDTGSGRWSCLLALLHTEAGRADEAAHLIETLAADRFASMPTDQSRPGLLALTAEAVAVNGTEAAARELFALLSPWSGQSLVMGAGAACLGAADHFLGRLAARAGDGDMAERLLQLGLDQDRSLAAPLLVGRSRRALDELRRSR